MNRLPAIFSHPPVVRNSCQKHLGVHLDEKLNFRDHIKEKILKANKGVGTIRTLHNVLPRNSLMTICKSFI